jgi:hypothetical protein
MWRSVAPPGRRERRIETDFCLISKARGGIVVAGKYTPLEKYLRDLPEGQREITLRFEQIERILNDKLPPSAYEYWAWWANE